MSVYGKSTSPRKQMAMGGAGEGLGKPSPYPGSAEHGSKQHPDHMARTGEQPMGMDDGDRGIGHSIHHAKGHLPAQAAPHHGPHHERELGFERGGKV